MFNPYSPGLRLAALWLCLLCLVILCSGCAGFTDNAKQIRFQIPALLNMEFEYNDSKGVSETTQKKGPLMPAIE
tara:strand:- start:697 stop:918 length:222 start_codon:yes stop_codon:yes gene_type:complete